MAYSNMEEFKEDLEKAYPGASVQNDAVVFADGNGFGPLLLRYWSLVIACLFLALFVFMFAGDMTYSNLLWGGLLMASFYYGVNGLVYTYNYFKLKKILRALGEANEL